MGTNSRARGAAQQRGRSRRGPTPPSDRQPPGQQRYGFHSGSEPDSGRPDAAEARLARLLHAAETLPPDRVGLLVADQLVEHDPARLDELDVLATMRLRQSLVARWEYGWQPADLLHVVRRWRPRLVPLLAAGILAQARSTVAAPPAVWQAQLAAAAEQAAAARESAGPDRLVAALVARQRTLVEVWTDLVQLLPLLARLPVLEQLLPPPSAWARSTVRSRSAEDASARGRVLHRVRTLLAKAEATEFAAEAETFTAKAQDLMTRHAIDEALLGAGGDQPVEVTGVRVHLHNPYLGEKVALLNQVARANRCRAVWNDQLALVTVLGTPVDVDQVELLFTSLLIQATRALAEAGAHRAGTGGVTEEGSAPLGPPAFSRSASFRRSFLMAYAVRIGERLTETSAAAAASYGAELVPVLRRQEEAVEAEFGRLFPQTRTARAGRYNAVGWEAGRQAADRAQLTAGRLTA